MSVPVPVPLDGNLPNQIINHVRVKAGGHVPKGAKNVVACHAIWPPTHQLLVVSLHIVLERQSLSASSSIDDQSGTKKTPATEFPFITHASNSSRSTVDPLSRNTQEATASAGRTPGRTARQQSRRHARANPTQHTQSSNRLRQRFRPK